MYGLRDISDLAKLVNKYFKAKFEPNLVHITNLVNLLNRADFTDFSRVNPDFIDFKFF